MLLAFDGGQSGLRGVALDGAHEPLRTEVPGFSWSRAGDAVHQQADNIVAGWRALGSPRQVEVLAVGLAGGGSRAAERARLCGLLGAALPVQEVRSTTDDVVTHLGALEGRAGVALSAGTGVLCIGIDAAGARVNVDGLGYLFGDAGGAFSLGLAGIRAALAGVEGRGPRTTLASALEDLVGPLPIGVKSLYLSDALVAQVAGFARVVAETADDGDQVAASLCARAAEELATTVTAALGQAPALPPLLALGGGVLAPDTPVRRATTAELSRRHPGLVVVDPAGTALDGAVRLARAAATDGAPHLSMATVWRRGHGVVSPGSPDSDATPTPKLGQ